MERLLSQVTLSCSSFDELAFLIFKPGLVYLETDRKQLLLVNRYLYVCATTLCTYIGVFVVAVTVTYTFSVTCLLRSNTRTRQDATIM